MGSRSALWELFVFVLLSNLLRAERGKTYDMRESGSEPLDPRLHSILNIKMNSG